MPRHVLPVTEPGSLAAEVQPDIPMDDDLRLRPFELADVPAVLEAFSDPDIQRWHFRRFDSTDEAEAWVRSANDGWRSESAATWAIQSATETVVGRITLYPKLEAGHGEIGQPRSSSRVSSPPGRVSPNTQAKQREACPQGAVRGEGAEVPETPSPTRAISGVRSASRFGVIEATERPKSLGRVDGTPSPRCR